MVEPDSKIVQNGNGMKFTLGIVLFSFLLVSCNEIKLVSTEDILDLLEGDGTQGAASQSGSSDSSSRSSSNSGNSNNLNHHGMTDSATGTNTYGSTGSTVGNPLGY